MKTAAIHYTKGGRYLDKRGLIHHMTGGWAVCRSGPRAVSGGTTDLAQVTCGACRRWVSSKTYQGGQS